MASNVYDVKVEAVYNCGHATNQSINSFTNGLIELNADDELCEDLGFESDIVKINKVWVDGKLIIDNQLKF